MPPRVWPQSSGGLLVTYPGSSVRQRCLCSFRISEEAVSSAGTDVGRGSLETTGNRVLDIMCLTWDVWSYNPYVLLLWILSGPRIEELCEMSFSNKLQTIGYNFLSYYNAT